MGTLPIPTFQKALRDLSDEVPFSDTVHQHVNTGLVNTITTYVAGQLHMHFPIELTAPPVPEQSYTAQPLSSTPTLDSSNFNQTGEVTIRYAINYCIEHLLYVLYTYIPTLLYICRCM